jgi:hypothetical protein
MAVNLLCAAVVVLSPEFVRKKFPMRELAIFLERKARDPGSIVIVPVFHELTVEQCDNLEQLYASEPWPTSPGVPQVADTGVLQGWATDGKKLLEYAGVRLEQVRAHGEESSGCCTLCPITLGCINWWSPSEVMVTWAHHKRRSLSRLQSHRDCTKANLPTPMFWHKVLHQ